jgi:hypothetical protein
MSKTERRQRMSRRDTRRAAGAVGMLGVVTAAVAQQAADANFGPSTQTVNQTQQRAGTIAMSLAAAGTGNRLTVAVDKLYPGAAQYRVANVSITGNQDLATATLQVTGASAAVGTDATNGATVLIEACMTGDGITPTAWSESGSSPDYTYTCASGLQQAVTIAGSSAAYPIANLATARALSGKFYKTAGFVNYLRFTFSIPTTSTDASNVEGSGTSITFSFNGTQRAGAVK